MFSQDLISIGLSKGEAEVLSSLLQFGDSSATEIASRTHIGRTNVYEYAQELTKKGLISSFERAKKIYYRAENPNKLENFVNQKIIETNAIKSRFQELLPLLTKQFSKNTVLPEVEYLIGEGIEHEVMDKILTQDIQGGELFLIIPNVEVLPNLLPKHWSKISQQQTETYLFTNGGSLLSELQLRDARELRKTIVLQSDEIPLRCDMVVFGDYVAFGSMYLHPKQVTLVKSAAFARTITAPLRRLLV